MASSTIELQRLLKEVRSNPRLVASPEEALARLAQLGSGDPAAELEFLALWFEGDGRSAAPWIGGSAALAWPVGRGLAVVRDERLAAFLVAHRHVETDGVKAETLSSRFRPRRDALLVAAATLLSGDARVDLIRRLLAEDGPRESVLHLSLLQTAELVAAIDPALPLSLVQEVVDRLMPLVDHATPEPVLSRLALLLGTLAGHGGEIGERLRAFLDDKVDTLGEVVRHPERLVPRRSFLDEVQGIEKGTIPRDEAYFRSLPYRQARDAVAEAIGVAAALRGEAVRLLGALGQQEIVDEALLGAFLEGAVGRGDDEAQIALIAPLLDGGEADLRRMGLLLVAERPIDGPQIAESVRAALRATDGGVREAACKAADALGFPSESLVALLRDPSLPVARAAAEALARRGESSTLPADLDPARRLELLALLGGGDPVAAEALLQRLVETAEEDDTLPGQLLGRWIRRAPGGVVWLLDRLAEPEAPALALSLALGADSDEQGILAVSDEEFARLLATLRPRLLEGGEQSVAAALLLASLGAGRRELVDELEAAWIGERLPDDLHLAAMIYGLLRVRDGRAAERLSRGWDQAELPAMMLAAVALSTSLEDGRHLSLLDEIRTLGSYGVTTAYNCLVLLARDLPSVLA